MPKRCALGLALALGATPLAAGVDPLDAQEIVETLLGIAPSRHSDPLAAMHGWAALYAREREAAQTGDPIALRAWLLVGFASVAKAEAGTVEAFSGDLLPYYRTYGMAMLGALADNGWLVPATCFLIGNGFTHEGRNDADRAAFLAEEGPRIQAAIPPAAARTCLDQIAEPRRP
jgi:hypothetical protein